MDTARGLMSTNKDFADGDQPEAIFNEGNSIQGLKESPEYREK